MRLIKKWVRIILRENVQLKNANGKEDRTKSANIYYVQGLPWEYHLSSIFIKIIDYIEFFMLVPNLKEFMKNSHYEALFEGFFGNKNWCILKRDFSPRWTSFINFFICGRKITTSSKFFALITWCYLHPFLDSRSKSLPTEIMKRANRFRTTR